MKLALLQVSLTLNNHWLDPLKQDSSSNRLQGYSIEGNKHLQMLHSMQKKLFTQYLKITWLSVCINKIPNQHLLVQS